MSLDIPENNLEREFLWYLTFHPKFYVSQNFSSWVLAQDALNWSDCRIPRSLISHKWVITVAYWLGLVWLKMTKCFKWSATFPLYIGLCKRRVLSNLCCLLVSHSFSQSVQNFSQEPLIHFSWLFSWSYIVVWSKNWQNIIFAENSFLLIFGQKRPRIRAFCIFFWKFWHLIFLKAVWKYNYFDAWLSAPSFMSGKILVI